MSSYKNEVQALTDSSFVSQRLLRDSFQLISKAFPHAVSEALANAAEAILLPLRLFFYEMPSAFVMDMVEENGFPKLKEFERESETPFEDVLMPHIKKKTHEKRHTGEFRDSSGSSPFHRYDVDGKIIGEITCHCGDGGSEGMRCEHNGSSISTPHWSCCGQREHNNAVCSISSNRPDGTEHFQDKYNEEKTKLLNNGGVLDRKLEELIAEHWQYYTLFQSSKTAQGVSEKV